MERLASTPRVLVADADIISRDAYRQSFAQIGCDVIEAADGREALVRALVREPSLILSDLHLPLLDGFSLCEILRRDRVTEHVPILIVTADPSAAVMDRARAAGADRVVRKSRDLAILMGEAKQLLDRSQQHRSRSTALGAPVAAQLDLSGTVRQPVAAARLSRSHERFATTMPPLSAPELLCPSCDQPLAYESSFVGGVSMRYPEQWDYFRCSRCEGRFQYRQRTRRLRAMA